MSSRLGTVVSLLVFCSLNGECAELIDKAAPRVSLTGDASLPQWRQLKPGDEKATSLNAIPYRTPEWSLVDGVLRSKPGAGDLMTRRQFGNYQLHLEWRNSSNSVDAGRVFLDGKNAVELKAAADGKWHAMDIAYTHLQGQTPKSTVWIDGSEVARDSEWKQPSKGGFKFPFRERTENVDANSAKTGKALFSAAGEQNKALAMGDNNFTVKAQFRTKAAQGGTLFAKCPPTGDWAPNAKALFIRGGKLCYDIGWLGVIVSKRSFNDGKWHTAVLTKKGGEVTLCVDGKVETTKKNFSRPDKAGHIFKIGAANKNFAFDFIGSLGEVRYAPKALPKAAARALSKGGAPTFASTFNWAPGDLGTGEPELPEIAFAALDGPVGPIRLQAGSGGLEIRKIWIRPLEIIDHAEMIRSFDKSSFARGQSIYAGLCVNCHGQDGVTPSLPQSRAFGKGEMKFGTDPHAMYLTLTHGNGLMGPQTWMEPRERYDVIQYIREEFMKPMRADYREVDANYLAGLPRGISGDLAAGLLENERGFGPALASQLQKSVVSAMTVKLGEGVTASYNLHDMSLAGAWKGGFLDLSQTQHERLRGEGQPQPVGDPLPRLQTWFWGHEGSLDYPKEGLLPRGPLPAKWLDYKGHFVHGERLLFSYAIDGRGVLELPEKQKGFDALVHSLRIGPGKTALKLCVGQAEQYDEDFVGRVPFGSATVTPASRSGAAKGHALVGGENRNGTLGEFVVAAVTGDVEGLAWSVDSRYRMVLDIPAGARARNIQIVRYAGRGEPRLQSLLGLVRHRESKSDWPDLAAMTKGGPANWPEKLTSTGELGSDSRAYTIDTLTLPESNPWNAWLRTAALDFMGDGRLVISTHGGDIWIVSGIDKELKELKWKRFAAGLYEPFGVKVVDDTIYVTCKDRIVRLRDRNGDGEADFYENFSADTDVSIFFHAFNFDLQTDKEGNFYYAKAGQYTDHALPGAIIKISPDGKRREVFCTGFRTPNGMGMMPDGRPTVSDNQGTWIPASKVSIVKQGGFYGYVNNVKNPNWAPDGGDIDVSKVIPPKTFDQPIIWMPQDFDNSSGGQLFVDDPRWGPLSGKLLHTSFGKGWLYYFMVQDVGDVSQAAIVKLPLDFSTGIHRARVNPKDGQVYAVGLNGWNGGGRKELIEGGIQRTRYTGAPVNLLTDTKVVKGGIELTFNFKLDRAAASKPSSYQLEQWNYKWLQRYGSDQWSVKNPDKQGRDPVQVTKVTIAPEGNKVFLSVPHIQPVNQVYAQLSLRTSDGERFEEQFYMTINRVPDE
jgi:hypothetical protein